jgi:ribonuclease G
VPLPAAKRELLVSVDAGERRVAVLEDEKVAEVYLERPERYSIAGNVYKGVVDNVLPGMEAAFVEVGLEKNGFLYVDEIIVPELEGRGQGRKIQELVQRGQEILVQAVKDPMKTKGARLTTDISLPGRFVVFVPNGEGLGVSRRLPDEERSRLREIVKALERKKGGVIVRTAAEGASAEDIERDLVFLERLWKSIEDRAKRVKAPALVYQEAELPLRVTRDLFTGDFERAYVDHDRTYKRVVGYLKKTSPHMVERVVRYKERTPLFEAYGVDAEIRSTLSRRVDLPSGGYLVFDYAEAFTVIDVNTGRFVGSRSRTSSARLEDTITKNNLEAVKEVVRQLRLRDIGGIIVIDFIDMANPKNRAAVEEALRNELERDRTKTYVVEISPLGLVEMTRQNVTDGPREILTKPCPTCAGDGIVYSEASSAIDLERRLGQIALGSRSKAFRIEVNAKVASQLIGPGASRLAEIEERSKRRFFLELVETEALDHLVVLAEGTVEATKPTAPVEEGAELELTLVEVGLYDSQAAVGKIGDYEVNVPAAAKLVGKKVKVRVERALSAGAYARLIGPEREEYQPLTAESMAERPTRAPAKKASAKAPAEPEPAAAAAEVAEPVVEPAAVEGAVSESVVARPESPVAAAKPQAVKSPPESAKSEPARPGATTTTATGSDTESEGATEQGPPRPKKRTRRGSRGGRRRHKPAGAANAGTASGDATTGTTSSDATSAAAGSDATSGATPVAAVEMTQQPPRTERPKPHPAPMRRPPRPAAASSSGQATAPAVEAEGTPTAAEPNQSQPAGDEPVRPKKRTRRGSRGGRRHRKPAQAGARPDGPPGSGNGPSSENGPSSGSPAGSEQGPSTPSESA